MQDLMEAPAEIFTSRFLNNFWRKVNKSGPLPDQSNPHYAGLSRCWEWEGAVTGNGYGHIGFNKRMVSAHRMAWNIMNGEVPVEFNVLHRCDNRLCCNPAHLFLGTHSDNMIDRHLKGRAKATKAERVGNVPQRHIKSESEQDRSCKHPERMAKGSSHGMAKLMEDDVLEIRKRWAAGEKSKPVLGAAFGVTRQAISRIVNRKNWKHI